jgi:hypothetical protein
LFAIHVRFFFSSSFITWDTIRNSEMQLRICVAMSNDGRSPLTSLKTLNNRPEMKDVGKDPSPGAVDVGDRHLMFGVSSYAGVNLHRALHFGTVGFRSFGELNEATTYRIGLFDSENIRGYTACAEK